MSNEPWLVFDYGGVISLHTQAVPAMAARVGVSVEAFEPSYWPARVEYDRGCPDIDYWRAVCEPVGVEVDEQLSADLTRMDIEGWLPTDDDTVKLLGRLAGMGARLALLSNAPSSFGRVAERQPWAEHFTHLVFSGDLRLIKPDAAIYTALLDTVGAEAADCLFVDDRQVNVDGACAVGLAAHLWTSADELAPTLIRFATGS
ncbi:HAD family hydrolase [Kutzneria sp. CA-103260]|uniref:HAD family hydrolase n=1 Tax=Kutzneria sp. CA-103260 TaxID=2802641 RepID=UPI001BEEA45B|nr:HAD family phosphatase [Kutzneria sp. CA-103260]QUQ70244.1 HAD superfamily hydrolase [Kutzneria sp. CA-103260]